MNSEFIDLCCEIEELSDEDPAEVFVFIQESYQRQINLQQQS